MSAPPTTSRDLWVGDDTVASLVARFLIERGVDRVFGLQGGHIQPVWDQLARRGVRIVDVRDERAAVHMAHAHAELTGSIGVAMATAGPGVTNTVTAMANAHVSGAPVLLLGGCPPRPQVDIGALQDVPHADVLAPITRRSRTLRVAEQVLRELSEGVDLAFGDAAAPGPVYLEIPTDVLRERVAPRAVLDEWFQPTRRLRLYPDPVVVEQIAQRVAQARRPVVITGAGAREARAELVNLLDVTGAAYLDTQESRGLVPPDHPSVVGAMRSTVMGQADLVLVIGRKLDYQLGYGSPAVFPQAEFIRISPTTAGLADNRRGSLTLLASTGPALAALSAALRGRPLAVDRDRAAQLRSEHERRSAKALESLGTSPAGADGRMHPNRILHAIHQLGLTDAIGIADGGDLLSFARIGLTTPTYLDSGAFGCLGVGVPFAVAAALAYPERTVISVNGDGAFGINAIEVDTAVRHGARAVFVVSNNAAWNIERYDQETNYGLVAGTELGDADYAAMARGLGAHGERVTDPAELVDALKRAVANAPAVVDVVTTRDAVSSDAKKGLGYVPDLQALQVWDDAEQERRRS